MQPERVVPMVPIWKLLLQNKTFCLFMQSSSASDFVARFVALSKKSRANEMVPEINQMLMETSSPGFEISPQEEMALRLKPNKMFKKAS